jgi:hypothetical protein
MSKFYASMALLLLLAVGRGAGAAEAIGWITHLDQESDRFILDDGRIFDVSEDISFASLRDGVRVRISYDTFGGGRVANDIVLAPQLPQSAEIPQPGKSLPTCVGDQKDHMTKHVTPSPNSVC